MLLAIAWLHCAPALPAETAAPVTLVAFGDSTTAPRGSLAVYADVLREELSNVRVLNTGRGGDTTETARARFARDVLAHKPDVAIIQFGINDASVDVWDNPPATQPRVGKERFAANLRFFAQELKRNGAQVILMTPNPLRWTPKLREYYGKPPYLPDQPTGLNVLLDAYAETVRRVARDTDAVLVDVRRVFEAQGASPGGSVEALLLDGMHPNERGQRLVADALKYQLLLMAQKGALAIHQALPGSDSPRWTLQDQPATRAFPSQTDAPRNRDTNALDYSVDRGY